MEMHASVTCRGKISGGQGPDMSHKRLAAAVHEATAFLEAKVKEKTPTGVYGAKGGLRSTIAGEVQGQGTPLVKGIIGTASAYGEVIEKGRRPGKAWPPPGVLQQWIAMKMGINGEEEIKQVEFLVRAKIAHKGFPGVHMFENAFKENLKQLQNMFDRHGYQLSEEMSR